MPKLPQVSGQKLIKAFLRDDWVKVGTKGSHVKLRKYFESVGQKTLIIPLHTVLKKGTLSGILKDSGISLEKLNRLL